MAAAIKKDDYDFGEPSQGVFELAREILARHNQPDLSHDDYERIRAEIADTIRNGRRASGRLYDDKRPKDRFEQADLSDASVDGFRYAAAESLLEKATQMMVRRKKHQTGDDDALEGVSGDAEGAENPAKLVEFELEQLHRRIFEGWKPSAAGPDLVEKVFSGSKKGPETLSLLMQIYGVASHGNEGTVSAEQLAQGVKIRHGRNAEDQERTKVIVPAAIITIALGNEQQKGR